MCISDDISDMARSDVLVSPPISDDGEVENKSQTASGMHCSWGRPEVGNSYVIRCELEKEKALATSLRVVVPKIE